jgi:hypothetical protein
MAMGKTGDSDIKHKNRREYIIIMVVMFKVDIIISTVLNFKEAHKSFV